MLAQPRPGGAILQGARARHAPAIVYADASLCAQADGRRAGRRAAAQRPAPDARPAAAVGLYVQISGARAGAAESDQLTKEIGENVSAAWVWRQASLASTPMRLKPISIKSVALDRQQPVEE